MSSSCRSLSVLALLLAFAMPVRAAGLTDERVAEIVNAAVLNIQKAACDNNRPCSPATTAERQRPPISLREARGVMARGAMSAQAAWCGLDWQHRVYLPMMLEAQRARRSDRQLAIISLIHGFVLGDMQDQLKKGGTCSAAVRADLDKKLPATR